MKLTHCVIILTLLSFAFTSATLAQEPVRKGWWKFDDAANSVKAEPGFGSDLELVGSHQWDEGPEAGNGCARIGVGSYYKMTHGIAPNGSDSLVNEFSLQIDFLIPALGSWYTFFQTNPDNSDDGECFINTSGNIGVAATGYSAFALAIDEWYRLTISVNNGTHYRYYLDGQMLMDGSVQEIDGRFGLETILLLFADNDGDDAEIDVAEVAIWDVALTSYQVQSLGGFGHELPKNPLHADGRWKFDNADNPLEGYYGKDLQLVGSHEIIDGPTAANKAAHIDIGSHYIIEHGMAPNGGGAYVNEYSLQFDFRIDTVAVWRAFFQTNPANSNDADCFINTTGNIGTAATGYGPYKLIPQEWYRLIISVKNGDFYKYYLDGQLLLDGTRQDIDGRFALENTLLLFADNDGDDGALDVAETAIWSRALDSSEVVQIGGYGHSLSDTTVTTGKLVGKWKFDDANDLLKAEPDLGLPLELVGSHAAMAGPDAGNGAVKIGVGGHYKMSHGIAPNGGGAYVNEYSLLIDFKAPVLGVWNALFQTSPTNSNDGDCFINTSGNIGVAATGYSSYTVKTNEWYRLVISVKNGTHYQYYLDGQLLHNGNVQSLDGRFALDNLLLVFADEDGEDNEIHCAELAIWNYPLSAAEVAALGGYHPSGVREKENQGLIKEYQLAQNFPNPFNPTTTITYAVARSGQVKLQVFNQLGQQVATLVNEYKATGLYKIDFSSKELPSGLYFYRLETAGFSKTMKMILMK